MLGILSDTHENIDSIEIAVKKFKSRGIEHVVHCGDIISPPVLKYFSGLTMHLVFGNNDGERDGLKLMAKELGFSEPTDELELELEGKKLYAYHGTKVKILNKAIESQNYDYVLTGHTHKIRNETLGRTRVINPGALFLCSPYTIAVLDLAKDILEIVEIQKKTR